MTAPPTLLTNAAARGKMIRNSVIFSGLGLDFNRPAMLLHDDIVTDGEAKAGPFSGWLGGEERIENLFLYLGRNPGAVVSDPEFPHDLQGFAWTRPASARRSPLSASALRLVVA